MTMSWELRRLLAGVSHGVALFICAFVMFGTAALPANGADGAVVKLSKPKASRQKVQTGLATYYARRLHGRKTASTTMPISLPRIRRCLSAPACA